MKPKRPWENHYSEEERCRAMWLFGSAGVFIALMILVNFLVKINN